MKKIREGYKMTELGEIPIDWEIISLESLGEFKNGINKGKDDFGFGLKFVNIQDAYIGNLIVESRLGRLNVNEKEKEIYKLINGDIVVVRSSVKPEGVGYPILFDGAQEDVVYCGFMIRYRYNIDKVNPLFMLYQLRSSKVRKQVLDLSTVSANTNINQESYKKVKIILPTKKEQEKIASILSNVDEQIDNVEALIEKNKELKKGLMQTLLTKGIGHTKFKKTEIGEIPEEWDVIKFFDFVDKIIDFRGRTPKKLGMDWGNGDIQALSANNVKMGKIDFSLECYLASEELYEKWMSGNELKNGDIIMTMEAPLGNVALVPDERKYILSQRVIALKTKDFINNKFMKYMLMSDGVQRQLETLSTGTTAKGINQKNLARVYVKIPMIKEQEKIASILFKIDEKIEEYENKKQKLEVIKKGLMQKLLTGEIRGI